MAGGALGGVIGAALRVLPNFKEDWIQTPFYDNDAGLANRFRAAVCWLVSVCLVRLAEEGVFRGKLREEN